MRKTTDLTNKFVVCLLCLVGGISVFLALKTARDLQPVPAILLLGDSGDKKARSFSIEPEIRFLSVIRTGGAFKPLLYTKSRRFCEMLLSSRRTGVF